MRKVATKQLKRGFTVVANAGTEIEVSQEDIDRYGWADGLEDAGDADTTTSARRPAGDQDPNRPAGS